MSRQPAYKLSRFLRNPVSLLWLGVLILNGPALRAQSVQAAVDANRISQGDVISFRIEAQGTDETPRVDISPMLDDFSVVSGPATQTNIQWINGKMTQSKSLSWTLSPKRAGTLTIPGLDVSLGRMVKQTEPIVIRVGKSATTGKAEADVFLKAEIDQTTAYVGEQVTVTYKLYTRVGLSIQNLQVPKHVGFWTEELYVPKTAEFRDTRMGGVNYKVATLYSIALFPTKSGELPLEPMQVRCSVETQQRSRRRSIWDDPFFNNFNVFGRQRVTKVLRTEDQVIEVKPYSAGQPPDFTGAVGQFSLNTSLDTAETSVNEAVTLKVTIHGTGNISQFTIPDLNFPSELEVFSPTTNVERDPFRDQITGTMAWEYILMPRHAGRFMLPRVELPYFNPEAERWERTVATPLQVSVAPGEEQPLITSGYTKEEVALLGKDIRYIRTENPNWIRSGQSVLTGSTITFYVLALAFYFIPGVLNNVQDSRHATEDLRRSRSALRKAQKALKGTHADPFAASAHIIYIYLKDRFLLISENLDPRTVDELLRDRIDADDRKDLVKLLKTCDAGRYAPGAAQAQSTLIHDAHSLLKRIDRDA